MEDIGMSRLKR